MLIGNYSVLQKSPAKFLSGSTISDNRSNFNKTSRIRNIYWGSGISKTVSIPNGYYFGYLVPQSTGGMASNTLIIGSGQVSSGNLAGGLNAVSSIVGEGTISNAEILWLILASAGISGSGIITNSDLLGVGSFEAVLTGLSDIAAEMLAAINAEAALTGSGTVTVAQLIGALSALADLTGSGTITSGNLAGVIEAISDLVGSGTITSSNLNAIWNMIASPAGTGTINSASLNAIAYFTSALTGIGTAAGYFAADGDMSASIVSTGDLLTTANVSDAVWGAIAESSLSYQDIMKILLAIASGKTTIVDLGGGMATVSFRDVDDSKDRLVADMTGSERIAVTLDPT